MRTRRRRLLRIGPAGPRAFESRSTASTFHASRSPTPRPSTIRRRTRTREAREATFTDVFAPMADLAGALVRARPGARAQSVLGRCRATARAAATGVRTSLRGPFEALTGSADVDGKGLSLLRAPLAHHRYALDANFRALNTRPLLARNQRSSLGGRLDGHFAVTARLGAAPKGSGWLHARRNHARPSTGSRGAG